MPDTAEHEDEASEPYVSDFARSYSPPEAIDDPFLTQARVVGSRAQLDEICAEDAGSALCVNYEIWLSLQEVRNARARLFMEHASECPDGAQSSGQVVDCAALENAIASLEDQIEHDRLFEIERQIIMEMDIPR